MLKVLAIFGTRPEAVKMSPLILELQKTKEIKCTLCLSGQHREMLQQVMEAFQIREDYNLDIMEEKQSLSEIMIRVMEGFENVLKSENPDMVLVHGDTTTSFAAALSAFHSKIPVGHVEAGLRTYDMYSPFPEEFNRQAVDMISSVYFAPTEEARNNLLREGREKERVYVTGNTVIDALKYTVKKNYSDRNLEWVGDGKMILLTTHRRENLGEPMRNIFRAVRRAVDENRDVKVIYPVHRNSQIREMAEEYFGGVDRVRLTEPLDVFVFHNYIARSFLILTDSGGIQEEASFFGVPVLVLRDVTERPEGLKAGVLKLAGTEEEKIYQSAIRLLREKEEYQKMSHAVNLYGDGTAAEKITDIIVKEQWRK